MDEEFRTRAENAYYASLVHARKTADRKKYTQFVPRRVDDNQKAMVKVFRQLGASIRHTHMVGKGLPDIIICVGWLNCVVEVKDGSKTQSDRKFTDDEEYFFKTWPGLKAVCCNTEDAQAIVAAMKEVVANVNLKTNQIGNKEAQYHVAKY